MNSSDKPFNHLWFPFTSAQDLVENPPITIRRGEGMYLYDDHDRSYLDAVGSWWVSILGHNHPEVSHAIRDQLSQLEHVMMAGFVSEPALRLSELLVDFIPNGLDRVFYSDDGSTAVEAALKMAIQYWSLKGETRTRFVAFSGAYHGDTLGAMSVGSIPHYHDLFHERFSKQLFTDPPSCYRCPVSKNPETCGAECMDSLEKILDEHGEQVAAFIFEPIVQGAAGMRVYPAKVLTRAFEICRRYGILTIDDEVAMGFGRTGKRFACEHAGVVPDIMCLAKGLTAGYLPLSATVVSSRVYEEFKGAYPGDRIFHHGHSFTGNPLAASAAVAALTIFTRDQIPESLSDLMTRFRDRLKSSFEDCPIVGDIRSVGMVGALELVADRATRERLPGDKRIADRVCNKAVERGILLRPLGDVIYFIPAFIITEEQIDHMFGITRECLDEVLDEEAGNL